MPSCPRGLLLAGGGELYAFSVGRLAGDGDGEVAGDGDLAEDRPGRGYFAGQHVAEGRKVGGDSAEISQYVRVAESDQAYGFPGGDKGFHGMRQFPAEHADGASIRSDGSERRDHEALTVAKRADCLIELIARVASIPGVDLRAWHNLAHFLH